MPIFIAALFATAKTWKQPKCPLIGEWTKKMWYIYIYTHNGIPLNYKKWNNAICSNTDWPKDYHIKSDKERQISYGITYMSNLKNNWYKWTYLWNRNRLTDIENKLMVTKGESGG